MKCINFIWQCGTTGNSCFVLILLYVVCYRGYSDWYRDENVVVGMACEGRNARDLRTSKGM